MLIRLSTLLRARSKNDQKRAETTLSPKNIKFTATTYFQASSALLQWPLGVASQFGNDNIAASLRRTLAAALCAWLPLGITRLQLGLSPGFVFGVGAIEAVCMAFALRTPRAAPAAIRNSVA